MRRIKFGRIRAVKRTRDQSSHRFQVVLALIGLIVSGFHMSQAVPKFARSYGVSCQTCHVVPPQLNLLGQEFVARGYRFEEPRRTTTPTIPVAGWVSFLGQRQPARDFVRGIPNRVELIAADALSPGLSYFVEWRVVSLELRANGSLRDRSGRFEDMFVIAGVLDHISVTIGQFRLLSQIDVSQRLSISEPLPYSSSLRGERASTSRLTAVRSFSPSGRSPALRAQYRYDLFGSLQESNGWFTVVNVPMSGEFSLPLTNAARTEASFEFEAIPKGVFLESFLRQGFSSIGAHLFAGSNERIAGQVVGTTRYGGVYWNAVIGVSKVQKNQFTNVMLEAAYSPISWGVLATRIEHQAGVKRKPSIIPYGVVHFPGTSYTIRLALEHRIQRGNNQLLMETSLIF